jgi:hypothetical protein
MQSPFSFPEHYNAGRSSAVGNAQAEQPSTLFPRRRHRRCLRFAREMKKMQSLNTLAYFDPQLAAES